MVKLKEGIRYAPHPTRDITSARFLIFHLKENIYKFPTKEIFRRNYMYVSVGGKKRNVKIIEIKICTYQLLWCA